MAKEKDGITLDTTGLVHEAWIKLQKSAPGHWQNRQHFFGTAAEAMRRILVDAARRRLAKKRGGGAEELSADELELGSPVLDERLLGVHEVLDQLEKDSPLQAQIVKLRFFGGMKLEEIAALLETNKSQIRREWSVAKVWLYRELNEEK